MFEYRSQLAYLEALGTDPDSADGHAVIQLLDRMRVLRDQMTDAARWARSHLDEADAAFAAPGGIHTVRVRVGDFGRHALDYEIAAAEYKGLQDQLAGVVVRIRQARGETLVPFPAHALLEDVTAGAAVRALVAAGPELAEPADTSIAARNAAAGGPDLRTSTSIAARNARAVDPGLR